ncbi:hypothetical protein [Streptomyces sp. NPDC053541]|uniref:hypothetical protein n=1 Tax=Streptomyces sp. NPDC053541 TaxID=3365709 RepID=UPI0037CF3AA2
MGHEARPVRQLWVEDEKGRSRLPDPVRTAAVRAVLITSVTLIQATIAFFCSVTGSWLAFPLTVSTVAGTVVATWSVLDVWVTRQVWRQRNGVVSEPSSVARQARRERRREERAARAAARKRAGKSGGDAGADRAAGGRGHEGGAPAVGAAQDRAAEDRAPGDRVLTDAA